MKYPPPPKGVQYHTLDASNKAVKDRVPIWVHFPVAFCIEAMNWHPYWYQKQLLEDDAYFIACCWSRQIGKSETIAHKALHTAFTRADSDVIIIAPGRRQAYELYDKIVKALNRSPLIRASVRGKPTKEQVTFLNGSRIINLPAGDEGVTVRGYSIALLVLEEAAFIPENVIVAVEQGLSAVGGKEIMISTPQGRNNVFYRIFNPTPELRYDMSKQGHQTVGDWSLYRYSYEIAFQVTRQDGSTQLSKPHIMAQKRKLPEFKFRTEYQAEFIEDIDAYFPQKIIDACFSNRFVKQTIPDPEGNYFMGIDIARGGDYTALAVVRRFDSDPKTGEPLEQPHVQLVQLEYWKMGRIEQQYPLILALVNTWNPKMIYFDMNALGARPFEELQVTYQLPVEGVPFSNMSKIKMYGTLTLLMSQPNEIESWDWKDANGEVHKSKRFQAYYDIEAKKQFEAMVYEIPTVLSKKTGVKHDGTGFQIYAATGNDDLPDAIALACMCVESSNLGTAYATTPLKSHYRADGIRGKEEPTGYYDKIKQLKEMDVSAKNKESDDVSNEYFGVGRVNKKRKGQMKLNPYAARYNFDR
ncbi:MAG: terminase large subunit domain-containing protein [Candidatus Kariarchaeaceae archaeon]